MKVATIFSILATAAASLSIATDPIPVLTGQTQFAAVFMGDWGGSDEEPFTSAGQVASANAMAVFAEQNAPLSTLIGLGDNLYEGGVVSPFSERFNDTYEQVYSAPSLQGCEHVFVLGNHDLKKGKAGGEAQMNYKRYHPHSRWNLPALFYSQRWTFTDAEGTDRSVKAVFADSVTLVGNTLVDLPETDERYFDQPAGPEDPAAAEQYWAWIEQEMEASTDDYLFFVSHFPVYSIGKHGPTRVFEAKVLPLLLRYGAHALAGHDHVVATFEVPNALGQRSHIITLGNTAKCCYSAKKADRVPEATFNLTSDFNPWGAHSSWGSLLSRGNTMTLGVWDQSGAQLYEASIEARKLR